MIERRVVSADGTKVRFTTTGAGRSLVIVPGTLAPPELYQRLVLALAQRHQVHVMTRRGYGATAAGPKPCRFPDQVADLTVVLEELDRPAAVFGHSFGGVISLAVAAARPALVDRLVLYEPSVALLGEELRPMLRRCQDLAAADQLEEVVHTAFRVSGSPISRAGELPETTQTKLIYAIPGLIADLECATHMKAQARIWARTTAPVLLLQGELTTPEYLRSVAMTRAILAESAYRVLPEQAHFPKDIDVLAALISEWCQ